MSVRSAYRWLVRIYPAGFRARFEEGLLYAFDRDADAARGAGVPSYLWFCLRTMAGTVAGGLGERWSERRRSERAASPLDGMAREVRLATRRLVRRPAFTVTVIGTLALGLGATTSIYAVIDGVLLRPLPYEDGASLVRVGHRSPTDRLGVPDGGYLEYAERARTLDGIGIYIEESAAIAGTGEPLELGAIAVSEGVFPVLRVEPAFGRGFRAEDFLPGAARVALVSWAYWQNHLGADRAAVGGPLLPGATEIVIGVLPAEFEFLRPQSSVVFGNRFAGPDVYVPMPEPDPARARFGNFMYQSVARLAPGVSADEARAELEGLMVEAARRFPGTTENAGFTPDELAEGGYHPTVEGLKQAIAGDVAPVLWILLGAVALVLAIAVANVANLYLVAAEARRSEFAVRRALGAGSRGLATALLSESALLAGAAGVLGLFVATAGLRGLLRLVPADVPRLDLVRIDARVMLVSLALAFVVGIGLGLVPLLRARSVAGLLREESRGATSGRVRMRARAVLLAGQIALSVILVVGSLLLVRTFANLRAVDPGFDPGNTLTLRLSLSYSIVQAAGRPEAAADLARSRFMMTVVDRVAALPGVERAAFSGDLPLDGDEWHDAVATEDAFPSGMTPGIKALRVFMGPDYLEAIGARLLRGREFVRADFADQPRVAVVNRAFADQRWPDGGAIGRRIAQYWAGLDPTGDIWYDVVGIVENIRETSLVEPAEPTVYLPTAFLPDAGFGMFVSNMVLVVRTAEEPMALLPRVRAEIHALRPDIPINTVRTLEEVTARSFQDVRLALALIAVAAAVSLLLGIVGIYGTVSWVVGQRTREFGLRLALGATGRDLLADVLVRGTVTALVGVGAGLAAAVAFSRLLRSMLYGVQAADPVVYVGVASIFLCVTLIASAVPAARARAVDPAVALRGDRA